MYNVYAKILLKNRMEHFIYECEEEFNKLSYYRKQIVFICQEFNNYINEFLEFLTNAKINKKFYEYMLFVTIKYYNNIFDLFSKFDDSKTGVIPSLNDMLSIILDNCNIIKYKPFNQCYSLIWIMKQIIDTTNIVYGLEGKIEDYRTILEKIVEIDLRWVFLTEFHKNYESLKLISSDNKIVYVKDIMDNEKMNKTIMEIYKKHLDSSYIKNELIENYTYMFYSIRGDEKIIQLFLTMTECSTNYVLNKLKEIINKNIYNKNNI